jgi:hypothetical protein
MKFFRPIAVIAATVTLIAACAPVRPAATVAQEQAACYALGPQSQACAEWAQDKAAIDHNAQVGAVVKPLAAILLIGAAVAGVAGVAAHGPHGPPAPHGPPPPHP